MLKKKNIEITELVRDNRNGESINSLSKTYNCCRGTISKMFKKSGIKIWSKNDYYNSFKEKIIAMFLNNKSINDIESELKVPATSVWRILKNNNINTSKNNLKYHEKMTKYKIDDSIFDIIDNDFKAYILGFLYADGVTLKNVKQIRLKLQEKDVEILNKIKEKLNYDRPLIFGKKVKKSHQNSYTLIICSKRIYRALVDKGMVPNKTFTLKFPHWLGLDLMASFVRGYFDGDGSITYSDKNHKFPLVALIGSTQFCNDLQTFLKEKLNIHSIISHDKRVKEGVDTLRLRRKNDIKIFYEWMYSNSTIQLNRKYKIFANIFGEL